MAGQKNKRLQKLIPLLLLAITFGATAPINERVAIQDVRFERALEYLRSVYDPDVGLLSETRIPAKAKSYPPSRRTRIIENGLTDKCAHAEVESVNGAK